MIRASLVLTMITRALATLLVLCSASAHATPKRDVQRVPRRHGRDSLTLAAATRLPGQLGADARAAGRQMAERRIGYLEKDAASWKGALIHDLPPRLPHDLTLFHENTPANLMTREQHVRVRKIRRRVEKEWGAMLGWRSELAIASGTVEGYAGWHDLLQQIGLFLRERDRNPRIQANPEVVRQLTVGATKAVSEHLRALPTLSEKGKRQLLSELKRDLQGIAPLADLKANVDAQFAALTPKTAKHSAKELAEQADKGHSLWQRLRNALR